MDFEDVTLIGLAVAGLHVLGVVSAADVVMRPRTSQGAIAWAISLVTFPYVALPFYWAFGRRKHEGYVLARRGGDSELQRLAHTLAESCAPFVAHYEGRARGGTGMLEKLVAVPFLRGNALRLLIDGDAAFTAMFEAIDRAQRYVIVQFYIIRDDELGRDLQRRLLERAAAGVRVMLLYDPIGCASLPSRWVDELAAGGVEVAAFRKMRRGFWRRWKINFRNHRKIVVVDGEEAFVGGLNVGDEYVGKSERFGPWRDTHLGIRGPAVDVCQLTFTEDWFWATERLPELEWAPRAADGADQRVLVFPTGPADRFESCGLLFTAAIHAARERLWIASPYFVPDVQVISALQLAVLRGVDVRILLPEKVDHLLVWLASYSFYEDVLPAGVRIYRYLPGFLHQKVMLVDDVGATVGTANLDNRSFRLNFELTVIVDDDEFVRDVEAMLTADFERSREVSLDEFTSRNVGFRFASAFARLLAPIL